MTDKPSDKQSELAVNPLFKQPVAKPAVSTKTRGRGAGRPFEKGQSGNPKGRPIGSKDRFSAAFKAVVEEHLEKLLGVAMQRALDGDLGAIKLLLSSMPNERKEVAIDLPKISSAADLIGAGQVVAEALAAGQLSPDIGKTLLEFFSLQARNFELTDIASRLTQLEARYAEADTLKFKTGGKP